MATNDIFMMKLNQQVVGKPENILNVFFFRQTSSAGTAEGVIKAFEDTWQQSILNIQSLKLNHVSIEAINLYTVDDFATMTYAVNEKVGTQIGDMFPIHDAITFRLVRTSRDIRNGYKRFGGIPENAAVDGVVVNPDYITALNGLSSLLEGSIEDEDDLMAFEHVVVKRVRSGAGTPTDPYKYRLPINAGEAEYSNPSNVLVNLFVRHQVSRGN